MRNEREAAAEQSPPILTMRIVRQPFINVVVAHAITHLGEIPQQRVHATSAEVSANTAGAHGDFCPECRAFAQVVAAAAATTFPGFIAPGVRSCVGDNRSPDSTAFSLSRSRSPATL